MKPAIAIVGMACRYPDARTPGELWNNVLAGRRAFRRMPSERLRLEDYYSPDPKAPDRMYATQAALIEDYTFDRVRFRVVGSTFRSADPAHWLALDVAAAALADAGFADGDGLPRETTGVLVGNTLTGEFSRANVMRLRWPYVRRVVEAALKAEGWAPEHRHAFLKDLEKTYKRPFPPVGEESLAGGLSNTIAGRICNHFDFKGGGYTVDGACAASLLAVINACSSLLDGDLDVALAGGVDLSLDPFELVGFAKTGALAPEVMRVFDRRSAGFWPGEGCGVVVLMRHEDAIARNRHIYAIIRGWGVSSDGSGGLTRPEEDGQLLALKRAYRRAGFGVDTVAYFEGHGTGTEVGDTTELRVLSHARNEAATGTPAAALGSIKANIGHTKAAAGIAGLIKTAMALHHQVLPPTTGCEQPHAELSGEAPALRILPRGEPWPDRLALRAGVNAMGFGGINTHVILEGAAARRRKLLDPKTDSLLRSTQDAELFLFGAGDAAELLDRVERLSAVAPGISQAELADLAAGLAPSADVCRVRASIVAAAPQELADALKMLAAWLADGETARLDVSAGVFLGTAGTAARGRPRIGFLFPGQGSPSHPAGGALRRRFASVEGLYAKAALPSGVDGVATEVAQPAIVTASVAGLDVLTSLGVTASVAVGHSLGELTALHWGGALDRDALLRVARARGKAMAELGSPTGSMAGIRARQADVERLLGDEPVRIAGLNAPRQTVISGESKAVAAVMARAKAKGIGAVRLPVSHAFHSPLVEAAAPVLSEHLAREAFHPLRRTVMSTVTGSRLAADADVAALLCRQVTSPVRFLEAAKAAANDVDLLIEVGPGEVLSGLISVFVDAPVVTIDAGGPSLAGLLRAAGAAYVLGAAVKHEALFAGRFTKPFDMDRRTRFLVNPCERAPVSEIAWQPEDDAAASPTGKMPVPPIVRTSVGPGVSPLEVVRQLVAARAELPASAVDDGSRLLGDLHLNSIAVGQLVAESARRLGLSPPVAPTDYADATVAGVARALEELARTGAAEPGDDGKRPPPGVEAWIRPFVVELVERSLPRRHPPASSDSVGAGQTARAEARGSSTETRGSSTGTRGSSAVEGTARAEAGGSSTEARGSSWQVLAAPGHPLKTAIQDAFVRSGGGGVVVCLPPDPGEEHVGLLVEGARAVMAAQRETRFVLVQHGGGGAAFARSLHLERRDGTTCVVDVPIDHPSAAEWVVTEAMAAEGYAEAHYDAAGRRSVPRLRMLPTLQGDDQDRTGDDAASRASEAAPRAGGVGPSPGEDKGPLEPGPGALGEEDVLLVTGGGRGIAAECALALAQACGVRLVLLGRSKPEANEELSGNLERMAAAGVSFRYVPADVTDAAQVGDAVRQAEAELGPVTAVLHGAGTNVPQLLASLDEAAFRETLRPKVRGLRNVLAAVDADRLRLLVAFGSIIARTGMQGEAHYAVANDWLGHLVDRWQTEHPHCRCHTLEWSVWSGAGMGERLGRVDALVQQGITPIPVDEGIRQMRRLIEGAAEGAGARRPSSSTRVVVTGRFGEPPTLLFERPELPLLRFVEQPRVHYPDVELVLDVELTSKTDPYLEDHVFEGDRLFPAVMGLEAMAQAAMALAGHTRPPALENVRFNRPVVVRDGETQTVRLAALVRPTGAVDVVVRTKTTGFQVDHFGATCLFGEHGSGIRDRETKEDGTPTARAAELKTARAEDGTLEGRSAGLKTARAEARGSSTGARGSPLAIDPQRDLYGGLLFHGGRFRRLRGYRRLMATECDAEISPGDGADWFDRYLPAELVLGDPGARDAAIHAIQACIPHARILPVAVDRILPALVQTSGPRFVAAREQSRNGDTFVYDLEVVRADGVVCEEWKGLHLKVVEGIGSGAPWLEPLLGPYLERRIGELIPGSDMTVFAESVACTAATPVRATETDGDCVPREACPPAPTGAYDADVDRRRRADRAIRQVLGSATSVRRRPDGRPDAAPDGRAVSAAHAGNLTLAVAAPGPIGCDVEPVSARSVETWRDLLGSERFALTEVVAREAHEDRDTAATRVWAACECLKKAGASLDAPLVLAAAHGDGWVVFSSGSLASATFVGPVRGRPAPLAVAVLTRSRRAHL